MELKYFYLESPYCVRIISHKLCLDHTFYPESSTAPITLEELFTLTKSDLYDSIRVCITEAMAASYYDSNTSEIIKVVGWVDLKVFTKVIPTE